MFGLNLRRILIAVAALVVLTTHAGAAQRVPVAAGDTLSAIAARHGVSTDAIAAANGLASPDRIHVGMTLVIPRGGTSASGGTCGGYVVQPGDTLDAIARRRGSTARGIAAANGVADPTRLRAGTCLHIGGAARISTALSPSSAGGHVVRPGETLWAIARRHGITAQALAAANGIGDPNVIVVGRRLRVPAAGAAPAPAAAPVSVPSPASGSGGTYVVRAGDTLSAIAARHGVSVAALVAANAITRPDRIRAGLRLAIPGRSNVPATPTASAPVAQPAPSGGSVRSLLDQAAGRHGVDPALVRAIAWQESGWSQAARSSAGAIGVMQLMPYTADWAGPALLGRRIDAYDVRDNIDAGAALLAWLIRQTGSRDLAVAAYYQGLGSVRRIGLYDDTRAYVSSVNSLYGRR